MINLPEVSTFYLSYFMGGLPRDNQEKIFFGVATLANNECTNYSTLLTAAQTGLTQFPGKPMPAPNDVVLTMDNDSSSCDDDMVPLLEQSPSSKYKH